jgi:O-antigen biosynthesis protein
MELHPSWQTIRDAPDLIAVPLDKNGLPALAPELLSIKNGDAWLIIAPATARLNPEFTNVVRQHAATRRDVGIFYADEVENVGSGANRLRLKPAINLLLLLAEDYIGSPVIVLLSVFARLGGIRPDARSAGVYDFLLRAIRAGVGIERIPVVLVAHEDRRPRPTLVDRTAAVNNWIGDSSHILALAPGLTANSLQLRRIFTSFPDVTLVIPTQQSRQLQVNDASFGKPHIINMLDSLALTDWPMERIKVLIGDDNPDKSIYADRHYPFALRRIETQRDPDASFNYAAKMNSLWRQADSEYIVLINDDIVVRNSGWLRALMTFAMNEDVAGVGARLLYGNGDLQHAGIPGGLFGSCAHAWIHQPAQDETYDDWAMVHREWSMVTGAVFATRRSVLEMVDGFDERFSLEFNDVDLCLRLKLLGYKIVYTPFAELLHFEKASRGADLPRGDQVALFLKRWSELLKNDPAFHPGFDMRSTYIAPRAVTNPWYETRAVSKSRPDVR